MKKVSFLFFASLFALTSIHAQQQKKDIGSKTIRADTNKKIFKDQSLPGKIRNPESNGGDEKMLNPQPLPPKEHKDFKPEKKGSEKMLNPQPLPPKEHNGFKPETKGSEKMLNPQPLPPKANKDFKPENRGSEKMLNPQPLPPKASSIKIKK